MSEAQQHTPKLGILFNTDRLDRGQFLAYAKRLDELSGTISSPSSAEGSAGSERTLSLWLPELFTRDPFAAAGYLLAHTQHLHVATGIANIYARDAVASVSAATTLQELSTGRFALGLGVSNVTLNKARGHTWQPPVKKLSAYLQAMAAVKLSAPQPAFPVYVAAHGPRMLAAAADLADGVNTYLMPAEHVRQARQVIGPGAALNTMLFCLVEEDPQRARQIARKAVAYYMGLDYYHRAWRSFGFTDADFSDGGSDALIDKVVAWGDAATVQARVQNQYKNGASTVVVIPLGGSRGQPDWNLITALAGA